MYLASGVREFLGLLSVGAVGSRATGPLVREGHTSEVSRKNLRDYSTFRITELLPITIDLICSHLLAYE